MTTAKPATKRAAPSTVFKKGEKRPNQGKRGPNKITAEVKDMVMGALVDAGGQKYLLERAKDPKTMAAFMGLVSKVMPLQVTGANGGAMVFESIVRTIVDPKA